MKTHQTKNAHTWLRETMVRNGGNTKLVGSDRSLKKLQRHLCCEMYKIMDPPLIFDTADESVCYFTAYVAFSKRDLLMSVREAHEKDLRTQNVKMYRI